MEFFYDEFFFFSFTVEYLWNYMRNNQKPRSSVLRKKPGKIFSFLLGSIEIMIISVYLLLMVELFEKVFVNQFCKELYSIFEK